MSTRTIETSRPSELAPEPASVSAARDVVQRLFSGIDLPVSVILADGTPLFASTDAPATTFVLAHPGVLRSLTARASDLAAGEAVVHGDIQIRGDAEAAFAAMDAIVGLRTPKEWLTIGALITRLPRTRSALTPARGRGPARLHGRVHSIERDRLAISYHYDVSNEFFALWLGHEMTYSCAYFRHETDTLDQAQADKYDLICRKLRLRAGERLLDVGCGWGGLVRFAAREYGARTVGITLSRRQAEYAQARGAAEGLDALSRVVLLDYRELGALGPFDKAASIGMVEHVGEERLPDYFRCVYDALVPGALFLNHGIVRQHAAARGLAGRFFPPVSRFIEQYVFPDGDIPRLWSMSRASQDEGFEVRDVENLREHYALTLRRWVAGLEAHEAQARALVGDETYNVWRFYMSGCARTFAVGRMGLVQMLLAKRTADGRALVPPTRDDIYAA
jgi:cyclopropane-fatty-acyl-phospholipid synthase